MKAFEKINRGFNTVFRPSELSLGMVIPIEQYDKSPIPTMQHHVERVQLIEQLGFAALWVRDIPLHVPSFGDAGQMFDPFTYLAFLVAKTEHIALGVASIALPLHHPLHVAKSATSIDQLSGGRFILGVASGDRPQEYPSMGINFEKRGELFREAFAYIRSIQKSFPAFETNAYGSLQGDADMLPKPTGPKIPLMMTGSSRQTLEWNAKHADGWMNYPRNLHQLHYTIQEYKALTQAHCECEKPFMHPLYIDLVADNDFAPQPIHLGYRIGVKHLIDYVLQLRDIGVNHIALNLRFNKMNMTETLYKLGEEVLPNVHRSRTKVETS